MPKNFVFLLVGTALLVSIPLSAGDGVVVISTAAPSCPDTSGNRYVDCSNGTVTDNQTGLTWLANADCFGIVDWHEAMEIVAGLADLPGTTADCGVNPCDCGLSDGSSPGDWRLPSIVELEVMMAAADSLGCTFPVLTDDAGTTCWETGPSSGFFDVVSSWYWSSTTPAKGALLNTDAFFALLGFGGISLDAKTTTAAPTYVWPVRGGQ